MMKCCLCGDEMDSYGHNPEPLTDTGRCCDRCNDNVVRFRMLVTRDNLRRAHPDHSEKRIEQLYEDLRIRTRLRCLMGERI